ncbi:MAG: 6,7-dimethyl-8-ribityllumazine synthase [Bacteroidaceae bacterium]|nr:6,7-dimethyl-8-ribityllumazine synthase [Bacteroidaceae bacterium]
MSTADHLLNDQQMKEIPNAEEMIFGIVVSEWNYAITGSMLRACIDTLKAHGAKEKNIHVKHVPGSFELTFGACKFVQEEEVDAVICFGSVVRGGTPHFDYVCQGVTQGIAALNTTGNIPVIFGVLTTDNMEQAEERAGGALGNKGEECAIAAIKMVDLVWNF